MEENLPPGFRFHPTDEELITYYLTQKVSNASFTSKVIADVDLNKCEPWDLPAKASMGKKEWYFFSVRDRKYPTGLRTNRATEAGYWKTTGKDKEIFGAGHLVGMKKTLVFYRGRAPRGEKSNWVMHEYRLENMPSFKTIKDEWVVCRVFQKSSSVKSIKPEQSPSTQSLDSSPDDTNSVPPEFTDIDFPGLSTGFIGSHSNNTNNVIPPNQASSFIDNNDILSNLNNSNITWAADGELAAMAPSHHTHLPWSSSSSLLSSTNVAVNSLILKALQLKSLAAISSSGYGYNPPRPILQPQPQPAVPAAPEHYGAGTLDLGASFKMPSSSSQQQQCVDQQQHQDQSFSWASFNEGI
ncbi:hypothetical protein SAY87_003971 [Trapa incisa]|uniref:NAC domain-containing protein n=2 Tax=Trapa TaxID=22665 RepID=A0AAN7QW92_TRANT|nr:hypothetical protein SAY87_003971 [Trapa incisa]KAK4781397.1 hypothetical protein SAY86_015499 [Trapa natans]